MEAAPSADVAAGAVIFDVKVLNISKMVGSTCRIQILSVGWLAGRLAGWLAGWRVAAGGPSFCWELHGELW